MTEKKEVIIILLMMLEIVTLFGGNPEGNQKVVGAIRLDEPVKIDGYLSEKCWQTRGIQGFIQSEPLDGEPSTEKTVVWVAYDKHAVYVAAYLYDSEPAKIIGRLGRRDDMVDSDWFFVSLDPYYDRRSGYEFGINPAGSILDQTIYNDEDRESRWDGIWESRALIHDRGWVVEMKIPFDQLRFKKKDSVLWGVNFRRIIKRKNEKTGLVWIPREDSGYVSHFARLNGITNIRPGRHIELLPFVVGKAAFSPEEKGNPFQTGRDASGNTGIDLKLGLKSNLTLDLTINPDFGQVEVDPAVINLSAAETYYQEKRPFFLEGANIFRFGRGGSNRFIGANWSEPWFFYSRRIGRPPQGTVTSPGFQHYPDWATILAAAKITGKVGNGWNIGFISAITEREYAQIHLDGENSQEEIEPFSYYGVLRVQKDFNKGRQGLGVIATSVFRRPRSENLENTMNHNAVSTAVDGWTFLDKNKTWVAAGWLGGTRVSGSQTAVWNLQHSYPHYFQRPDATHVEPDENTTSMSGWASRFSLIKQRGNFLFNTAVGAISPGFDSSDMGFQQSADVINGHIMVGYQSYKPGKLFRQWGVNVLTQRNYDFGGNKIGEQRLIFISNLQLLNYWNIYTQVSYNPGNLSRDLTRGGPLTFTPRYVWVDMGVGSDNRESLVFSLNGFYLEGKSGSNSWSLSSSLRWKPRPNFSISIEPSYSFDHEAAQWVTQVEDQWMTETYGQRYVFGDLVQETLSLSLRLNWIFNPKLSLQAYIQPFISVGTYSDFKELARPKTFSFNRYGYYVDSHISYEDGVYRIDPDGSGDAPVFFLNNPDFNCKFLRGTIVLRWEYKPGSTLYLVWTQNRADYSSPGDFRFGRDLKNLLTAPGDNIFMIKLTHRFKL